ncbi:hypothetical protein K2173_026052 [Erythroxylum novogranatense]|uniref:Phytocyanin domain-containing protein n=1 Tax=Erythroxylum novogranatense TaxID=1862640 RepID=A0AAV8SIE7_9ROSI|nr:hypothetical protein K2173_026052 [Erythroxylum novogranatense]
MAGVGRSLAACSVVVLLFLLLGFSEARDLLVGGRTDAWKIPSSQSESLTQWAQRLRFVVGDSLLWKYDSQKDSVLEVTKDAYDSCNTTSPIQEYKDDNTKVKLDRPGPFYFISGAEGHCGKGQKLIVVVITPRHRQTAFSPAPSPSSSYPAEFGSPAVAPTSSAETLRGGAKIMALGVLLWGLF